MTMKHTKYVLVGLAIMARFLAIVLACLAGFFVLVSGVVKLIEFAFGANVSNALDLFTGVVGIGVFMVCVGLGAYELGKDWYRS